MAHVGSALEERPLLALPRLYKWGRLDQESHRILSGVQVGPDFEQLRSVLRVKSLNKGFMVHLKHVGIIIRPWYMPPMSWFI